MKVGLVLEHFDPLRGGLEHWTCQFAKRLVQANCEVHIFACGFENSGPAGAMTFHSVENSPSPWKRALNIERALKAFPLDVIHDMGVGRYSDIYHPHGGSTIACWHHNLLRIPKWRQFRLWREKTISRAKCHRNLADRKIPFGDCGCFQDGAEPL
jgi:hypothetical protein